MNRAESQLKSRRKIHGNASVFLIQHHSIESFSLLIFREDEGQKKTFREPEHSPQYLMKKYLPRTYVLLPVSLDPLDEDVGWRSAERERSPHLLREKERRQSGEHGSERIVALIFYFAQQNS